MATSGQSIWFGLGDKSVRDYQHAAQIFRTNDFARAPKSKYLFYVTININPNATSDQFLSPPEPVGPNELNYLVKTVDMPRFEMDVQPLNQYNKTVLAQRTIRYNPVTIKFHDDNIGSLRHFWTSYYNYYFADGSYQDIDFTINDKYNARDLSRWGLDTGAKEPYLDNIEIYSFTRAIGSKITLQNPVITNFSHDTHDYSDGQGLLEASMSIRYTSVTYEDGIDAVYGIPGFGQNSPETYDTQLSPISNGTAGLQVNFSTGQLYDTGALGSMTSKKTYTANNNLSVQTNAYNKNNLRAGAKFTNNQLSAVLRNTYTLPNNSGYVFPTAQPVPYPNKDFGAVQVTNDVSYSDGQQVYSPDQLNVLYPAGSWQKALFEKGYSKEQISAADKYIMSQGTGAFSGGLPPETGQIYVGPNYQQIAEAYLTNQSSALDSATYGQNGLQSVQIGSGASVSGTYQGQTLERTLTELGYSAADITDAQQYISQLRLAPGTDLTEIAQTYINQKM